MIKKQYKKWQQLCKNKTCSFDPGRKREIFAEALSKLWDIGAPDAIQTTQKSKILSKERKAEDTFFMKTSKMQEKVLLEGKMLCIRKAFKNAKKGLHDQLLSFSLAVMMSLMKSRLASQALLPQIYAQVRNTSMLNKLVQAFKVLL